MSRKMSRIALFVVLALGAGLVAACGGGEEPPAPREFGDNGDATKMLPDEVESEIELDYHRKKFLVFIDADREYCIEGRSVIIFRDQNKDMKVGRVQTDVEGEASLTDKKASGKYFARLLDEPSARYGKLSLCLGAKSNRIRV